MLINEAFFLIWAQNYDASFKIKVVRMHYSNKTHGVHNDRYGIVMSIILTVS